MHGRDESLLLDDEPASRERAIFESLRPDAGAVPRETVAPTPVALALYRGLGFAELARRTNYYGAGRHALVMQYEITELGS